MRDKEYKTKSFRLSNKTIKELVKLKIIFGKSWNLFFIELIKNYGDEKL